MIASSSFLKALECTEFVFGRRSAPDPAGGAHSAPQTPSWFKGALLLRGGEGEEGRGWKGRGGERKVETHPPSIPAYGPAVQCLYCHRVIGYFTAELRLSK